MGRQHVKEQGWDTEFVHLPKWIKLEHVPPNFSREYYNKEGVFINKLKPPHVSPLEDWAVSNLLFQKLVDF